MIEIRPATLIALHALHKMMSLAVKSAENLVDTLGTLLMEMEQGSGIEPGSERDIKEKCEACGGIVCMDCCWTNDTQSGTRLCGACGKKGIEDELAIQEHLRRSSEPLKEGMVRKGGVGNQPTTSRPPPPKGQGGTPSKEENESPQENRWHCLGCGNAVLLADNPRIPCEMCGKYLCRECVDREDQGRVWCRNCSGESI